MDSIVVNIGNSSIRFGFFKNGKCEVSWIINTKPYKTRDELYSQFNVLYQTYNIQISDIKQLIIGSVVPRLTIPVSSALKKIHGFEPVIVDHNTPSDVKHNSIQMGTDIYANLVAAHRIFKNEKREKIILDFGTALTVSCVGKNGETLGVIIAPGIITALKSLISETAQLPEIELVLPDSILGFDTVSCMRSGIVYGYLGMIEGFIDRINKSLGCQCFVIATGGISHVYQNLTAKINITDKLHTVNGLYILGNQR